MKKILLFITSLTLFSFLIFILESYFFSSTEEEKIAIITEQYIEPTVNDIKTEDSKQVEEKEEKIKVSLKSAYKIRFLYFPFEFKKQVVKYTNIYKAFLNDEIVKDKIDNLKIEFHEEKYDVRGKMKSRSIMLYSPHIISLSESFSVMVHEFAHFVDLYFLKKEIFKDLSDYYYEISWESTKVLKPGMRQKDFVSGYAMTNKYEDFAESFTYFMLHNEDFLLKSKKSDILKKKYEFFTKFLFRDEEFVNTDFSEGNEILDYYRDITKIEFSLEKFLEFLKK